MFNALMSPATDAPKLVSALAQGISEHRILAWSSDPAQQEVLANSPMSGILPANNDAATTTGVFFRDMSASKMDFYLKTAAKLNTDVCTSATPTFTTTVDLASTITQEKADALPAYVASGLWDPSISGPRSSSTALPARRWPPRRSTRKADSRPSTWGPRISAARWLRSWSGSRRGRQVRSLPRLSVEQAPTRRPSCALRQCFMRPNSRSKLEVALRRLVPSERRRGERARPLV